MPTPETGQGHVAKARPTDACRNCGTPLAGPYCSACGQRDDDLRRPFRTFLSEFADFVLSLDSRLARTLRTLIAAPGTISRDYMEGKRARYVPPVRLVLVSVIGFFLLLELTGVALVRLDVRPLAPGERAAIEMAGPVARDRDSADGDPAGSDGRSGNRALTLSFFVPVGDAPRSRFIEEADLAEFEREMERDAEAQRMLGFVKRLLHGLDRAAERPELVNETFHTWLPRAMVILLPVFALILRGVQWGRGQYFVAQLVFVLHFHAFLFLVLSLLALLGRAGFAQAGGWLYLAIVPPYFLIAMKRFYRQGWFRTVLKFLTVSAVYNLLMLVTLLAIFTLGLSAT